ncbi:MAG TPA: gliding motility-associated C-terminal domain-containing protein, partial [Crocinitomicaceae bacterium]|nr:gliding motility-associated C-terminal domain-containing protein [Crocinitomicaceae bacterium]
VDHVPTVTFDPLADICNKGQTVPLVGSPAPTAGQSGVFSGTGVSGSNFSAATSGDGSFTLTYSFKDENGCANSATSSINVYPQPVASISGVDANYCLSDLIITPNVSPAGGVLSGPGVSNGQFSIAAAGVGTHTLKYVVVTPHGCADSTQVTVTISSNPTASFTLQPDICAMAAPIQLSGSPAGGIFTVNGQQITEFDPTSYTLGQYTITYSVADPINPQCKSTATNTINVVDGLPISSNIPDYFCFGSSDFNIVMTPAGGQLTANPSDILVGDQLIISSATDGTYSVSYEYTTPEGCHSTYDKTFTVGKELKLKYDFAQDCFQNVTLTAKPIVGNFVQYTWVMDNTTQIGSGNPFTGYIEQYGEHEFTVEAIDNHGCTATYSHKDSVAEGVKAGMFQIPNVVTANGDGVNDIIFMPMMDNDCINYEVLILNRWGNLVYKANKGNPTFGGKDMNGKALSDGVYFYKVVSESFDCDSDEYKPVCYGFITVISK